MFEEITNASVGEDFCPKLLPTITIFSLRDDGDTQARTVEYFGREIWSG